MIESSPILNPAPSNLLKYSPTKTSFILTSLLIVAESVCCPPQPTMPSARMPGPGGGTTAGGEAAGPTTPAPGSANF